MYGSAVFGITVAPHFLESGNYPVAVVLPFTNLKTTKGSFINMLFQILYCGYIYGILYIFIMVFIFFTGHILTEMRVLHSVAEKIGEYEELEQFNELERINEEIAKQLHTVVIENPDEDDDTKVIDRALKVVCDNEDHNPNKTTKYVGSDEQTMDKPNDLIKSSVLLRQLFELHLDVLWYV